MKFLGLGHMFNDVENGHNRNKNSSNCSNMFVFVLCEDLLLLLFVDNVCD